jgi:two-component sensor histidine kinase
VRDGPALEALRDTQARIDAIMQIHRRLYTSENVEVVDMREYLAGLVEELRQSLTAGDGRRAIVLDADPIRVPTDTAVSLGVVVAELVTNACKYAYADDRPGEVRIGLQPTERGARLVVEDDGEGFSPSNPVKGTGLGRSVINAMARNLNSKIQYDPAHAGARAVLEFAV